MKCGSSEVGGHSRRVITKKKDLRGREAQFLLFDDLDEEGSYLRLIDCASLN